MQTFLLGVAGVCKRWEQCAYCLHLWAHLGRGVPSNGISWPIHEAFLTVLLKSPNGVWNVSCS